MLTTHAGELQEVIADWQKKWVDTFCKYPYLTTFVMQRGDDESGVSGTGKVLEGAILSDGTVVVRWFTSGGSLGIYDSLRKFIDIHISSHPTNNTVLIFSTGTVLMQSAGTF